LDRVTVEMALQHPTWVMGPKITVDSATLMNKGLEVIEAHHLFGINYDRINVVVQRESIIHSLAEFVDGSFLAHLGSHDMRIPIQYALSYPERMVSPAADLDLTLLGALHFEAPDILRFPALGLAYQAGQTGGTMPAVLNAANEVAVNKFLKGEIPFTGIAILVERVMEVHDLVKNPNLESILQADSWARQRSHELSKLL
jgi:1-deoxy-D-xylulose-5-phosphate reductoisomerase